MAPVAVRSQRYTLKKDIEIHIEIDFEMFVVRIFLPREYYPIWRLGSKANNKMHPIRGMVYLRYVSAVRVDSALASVGWVDDV